MVAIKAKLKMKERVLIILARNKEAVSGAYLRKEVEYYIKKLGWNDVEFLSFLEDMEDQQLILKSVKYMKMHYELFNPSRNLSVLADIHSAAADKQKAILERKFPDLMAHAQRLKEDRKKEEELVHTAQREVIGADPEGFGVRTKRTL